MNRRANKGAHGRASGRVSRQAKVGRTSGEVFGLTRERANRKPNKNLS